jgi:hypothetical protein
VRVLRERCDRLPARRDGRLRIGLEIVHLDAVDVRGRIARMRGEPLAKHVRRRIRIVRPRERRKQLARLARMRPIGIAGEIKLGELRHSLAARQGPQEIFHLLPGIQIPRGASWRRRQSGKDRLRVGHI